MNTTLNASQPPLEPPTLGATGALSTEARKRMEGSFGEPWFLAEWSDVLMCHLEVNARELQCTTPFPIDRFKGRAFVTLVFFTLRDMRPRFGGWCGRQCFRPIATHRFLNVRTYVQHEGESGIYFLAEWLPNRLSVCLGPPIFGLPYRLGRFAGQNQPDAGILKGSVIDAASGDAVAYSGSVNGNEPQLCRSGSVEEWLMERYTAFTYCGGRSRYFRVWHPPWLQVPARVQLADQGLLGRNWSWMTGGRWVGANYSRGFRDIWMGRPHKVGLARWAGPVARQRATEHV